MARSAMESFRVWQRTGSDEDRLLKKFLLISIVVHALVLSGQKLDWFSDNEPLVAEWSFETDLLTESDFASVPETSLPKAKEAEEVKVPDNLLPQIPKNFALEEEKKAEEAEAEEVEKLKEGESKPDQVEKAQDTKQEKDDSNRVAMEEAMKRLALEKLRKDQKVKSKETTAPKQDPMARIRDELSRSKIGVSGDGGMAGVGAEAQKYGAILKKAIQKHYSLPQTFTSAVAKLQVVLAIMVDERGGLMSVKVHKSSNDPVFDEYSVRAAKAAAPYAKPPAGQVGKEIHLVFTR